MKTNTDGSDKMKRKGFEKLAEEGTLWTEEKLVTVIEKIITKTLDEQLKNLFKTISGNFEISKRQIAELKKRARYTF